MSAVPNEMTLERRETLDEEPANAQIVNTFSPGTVPGQRKKGSSDLRIQ